jgi:cytochrome c oxidase cbb3-type subunit III
MKVRFRLVSVLLAMLALARCSPPSGKPAPNSEVPRPDQILDSRLLFAQNCAGCHGAEGKEGPALDLSNPIYLALVDDDTLRATISHGRPGTAMSAFARDAGGMLTDQQVHAIVSGIRSAWGGQNIPAGVKTPPYAAVIRGDPGRGRVAYATFCSACHGVDDKVGPKAGSVTDGSYLSLISDQGLRTIVIAGRPDFQMPDWRGNVPGRPMTDQEITDVVAWLSSQRPNNPAALYPTNSSVPGGVR